MVLPFWGWESKSMPILKPWQSQDSSGFFMRQNVAIQFPPQEGDEGGGCLNYSNSFWLGEHPDASGDASGDADFLKFRQSQSL